MEKYFYLLIFISQPPLLLGAFSKSRILIHHLQTSCHRISDKSFHPIK